MISPLWVVDLAMAWIIVETLVWLWTARRRPGRLPVRWSLSNALAGVMLLLATRSVLAGWEPHWFLVFMALAGATHLAELTSRPR